MTRNDEFIGLLERYLDEYDGSTPLPAHVRDAVRARVPSTMQRPAWWPERRLPPMNNMMRIALASAAVVAAALVGYSYLLGGGNVGAPDAPRSSAGAGASISPDLPLLVDQEGPLDPGTYVVTEVEPHRLAITVPDGWTRNVAPATVWAQSSTAVVWFGRIEDLYADPCDQAADGPTVSTGSTAEDLAATLAGLPGLTAETSETAASGFSGTVTELSTEDPVDGWCGGDSRLWDIEEGSSIGVDPFGTLRVFAFDVNGDRIVLAESVRSAASRGEVTGAAQIVESLQIEAP